MPAPAALAVALASLVLLLHGRRFGLWPRPPVVAEGAARHRHFARLALRSLVHFGLVAALLLAAGGQLSAVTTFPAALLPARMLAVAAFGQPSWWPLVAGALAGAAIATIVERRGRRVGLGRVGAVTPARRGELGWGVLLALEAGLTEELFFRLLLPLLIAQVSGSALLGVGAATLLFGYAHHYQGIVGVVGTLVAGMLLALVYLLSGELWAAMLVHAAIDLNGLVLRPLLAGRVR